MSESTQLPPNVFGISGPKRHGKDTFSKFLVRARQELGLYPDFTIAHFAGELKRQAGVVFGLSYEQLDGSQKEAPFPEPVEMDRFLEEMSLESGLDIKPAGIIAKTPREIMQCLGTEYVRRAQQSYWVDIILKKVDVLGGHVLVSDTRFPNEADALRSIGGKVIKVQRLDLPCTGDGHSSETEMEKIVPDLLLGTMTDDFRLQTRVAHYIASGRFDLAQGYDYRKIERALAEFRGGANTRDVAGILSMSFMDAEWVLDYYKVNCTNCLGYRYLDDEHNVWRGQSSESLTACDICNLNAEANRLS
jgi:hypothetical protein